MLFKHEQTRWMKDKRRHSLAQSRSEDAPGHERAGGHLLPHMLLMHRVFSSHPLR